MRLNVLGMRTQQDENGNNFFGSRLYFFIAALIAIPVWLAINQYVKSIEVAKDDEVTSAATAFFMLGIFAGRYIARIWFAGLTKVPAAWVMGNIALLAASTAWMFFHADFPLKHRPAINLLLFWLPFMLVSLGAGVLVKMVRIAGQNQLKQAQLVAAQSKSELHLLQSQLSPHFLFNTLNNMYGLSITQHEKVPPLLLKLSELLRYSVYEATETFVPLKDEIAYINNYIDFEKIRIGERLVLTTDIEPVSADIKIAPMLLIVFIENAFKHAKNTAQQKIYVDIQVKTWGNNILFAVKNSHAKPGEEAAVIDKSSGFGLASVAKRLNLLYNNKHELTIQNEETFYNVMLQLKM